MDTGGESKLISATMHRKINALKLNTVLNLAA
jgi:hypothetical protein